jgi:hypothetical protein
MKLKVLLIENTSGRSRKVTLRLTPSFWERLIGRREEEVPFFGSGKVWFKGSFNGACTKKKTTELINLAVSEFEAKA